MRRTDREDRRGGWQLFHSISGGGGINRFGNFQAQTVSLRKGAYAFYDRRAVDDEGGVVLVGCQKLSDECHSERSET